MHTVTTVAALRAALEERRRAGERIGFVPTMGFLHEGHLKLVDESRERASCTVMSIFVNPLQFAPDEDLARYPRDPDGDSRKAASRGVDLLFTPHVNEMYGEGERGITVVPMRGASRWEGATRPGHFAGVLTVVAKLFNLVQPHVAIFGQKDAQQAVLVGALVRELDFPLELVIAPIVRDHDGLALSSRNRYLDAEHRRRALAIPAALGAVRAAFDSGGRNSADLERAGNDVLRDQSLTADYLAVVDPRQLEPRLTAQAGDVVLVAARVGATRLIDNVFLGGS